MNDLAYEPSPVRASDIGKAETGDGNFARLNSLREGDTVVATVHRFDPSKDKEPRYERFEVPYSKWMRVLDVLEAINEDLGVGLGYRWLCGVKKCGTCAVRMNGREVLACWEAAEPEMVIEPLRHAPLVRDLVVDRSDYEHRLMAMMPWMERLEAYAGFPEPLSTEKCRMQTPPCTACRVWPAYRPVRSWTLVMRPISRVQRPWCSSRNERSTRATAWTGVGLLRWKRTFLPVSLATSARKSVLPKFRLSPGSSNR